jgi:peptidoglycan/LPS O-acetylase OafA/YrhL
MSIKKILLALMTAVAAIVVFLAWTAWNTGNFGLAYIVGLGASVVLLALIWLWPGNKQPTRPPP